MQSVLLVPSTNRSQGCWRRQGSRSMDCPNRDSPCGVAAGEAVHWRNFRLYWSVFVGDSLGEFHLGGRRKLSGVERKLADNGAGAQ